MKWTTRVSHLIKEVELRKNPVIVRVNKFDEEASAKLNLEIAQAHNTGQKVIPVVIDSYGGQVYSLMAMISSIKHAELPIATIIEGKAIFIEDFIGTLFCFIAFTYNLSEVPPYHADENFYVTTSRNMWNRGII